MMKLSIAPLALAALMALAVPASGQEEDPWTGLRAAAPVRAVQPTRIPLPQRRPPLPPEPQAAAPAAPTQAIANETAEPASAAPAANAALIALPPPAPAAPLVMPVTVAAPADASPQAVPPAPAVGPAGAPAPAPETGTKIPDAPAAPVAAVAAAPVVPAAVPDSPPRAPEVRGSRLGLIEEELTDDTTAATPSGAASEAVAATGTSAGGTSAGGASTVSHGAAAPAAAHAPAADKLKDLPPPNSLMPVRMVRSLQRLQDKIAVGIADGLTMQRALIDEIDLAFTAAPQDTWQDPRSARALVIYTLSGGSPAVLRKIITQQPMPAIDERLLRGTLFYSEGREDDALKQLGEIDARTLPNSLGGQLALAQAALTVRRDPAKASALLNLARLLLPGTLVDEAALRRQILVASQSGDVALFERLSRQYLFRFRHSVYAGNFRQRFAAALTRMDFINDPAQFPRFDALLHSLDPDAKREVYLLVARAALTQGKMVAAQLCAERVLALAPPASVDAERARLYASAALAASSEGFAPALKAFSAADRSRLAPSDRALLDAASTTADLVRTAAQPTPQLASSANPPPADDAPPAAIVSKAKGKLETIDALLKEAPR